MTVLLGALIAVAPFTMDVYLASMPSMTRALAATPAEVQLTLSVYMYGWGVAQLFAGPLSDRFGRRPALLGGLAVLVAASIACALSRNVYALIGARLVQAVSMGTIAVVPRAVVRDLYSRRQGRAHPVADGRRARHRARRGAADRQSRARVARVAGQFRARRAVRRAAVVLRPSIAAGNAAPRPMRRRRARA